MRVYFFNWPSAVGGADTKLAHVLRLLGAHHDITVVPNQRSQLEQEEWSAWVAACGCRAAVLDDLPERLDGWAVSLCNAEFLKSGVLFEARRRGLRVAWSSEMMWHFQGECAALALGLIDAVLYVSAEQRRRLEPAYRHALGRSRPARSRRSTIRTRGAAGCRRPDGRSAGALGDDRKLCRSGGVSVSSARRVACGGPAVYDRPPVASGSGQISRRFSG